MALLPPPEAPVLPVLPLAAARRRLDRLQAPKVVARAIPKPPKPPKIPKPRGRQRKDLSPDLVIGMTAAGVPQKRVAAAFGVSRDTVAYALSLDPNARERIADLREKLKDMKMQRAHHVEGKLWSRLESEIDTGDAKSVDAIARSLLASEKIQAAASGEAHASGAIPVPPTNIDLKALIQVLVGS